MGYEYYLPLSNEDKLHANRKLAIANSVKLEDPYSNSAARVDEITKLTNVSWYYVTKYLIDTPSDYTKEAVKAFKSIYVYEFFQEGHVQDCHYHEASSKSFCFIKSKVGFFSLSLFLLRNHITRNLILGS